MIGTERVCLWKENDVRIVNKQRLCAGVYNRTTIQQYHQPRSRFCWNGKRKRSTETVSAASNALVGNAQVRTRNSSNAQSRFSSQLYLIGVLTQTVVIKSNTRVVTSLKRAGRACVVVRKDNGI